MKTKTKKCGVCNRKFTTGKELYEHLKTCKLAKFFDKCYFYNDNPSSGNYHYNNDYHYWMLDDMGWYLIASSFLPIVCIILVDFYFITISLITLILLAYGARFSYRLYKRFNIHAADQTIHNNGGE